MEEIKKIMADAKIHKVPVLNPDINESKGTFKVNKEGAIRFGLGGMKGFGANVVSGIMREREENGLFTDVWDFVERMALFNARDPKNNPAVNRRALESLVYAGAFDSFGYKRTQFITPCENGELFIDELCHYSDLYKNDKLDNSVSLFGDIEELKPVRPAMPKAPEYEDQFALLQKEKEIVGMYLSSHPLDKYLFTLENFTNCGLGELSAHEQNCYETQKGETVALGGMVVGVDDGVTRTGKPYSKITVEDFTGHHEFSFFGKDYDAFKSKASLHEPIFIKGEIKPKFFGKKDEPKPAKLDFQMRVMEICSLGTVVDTRLKSFKVHVNGNTITPEFRKEFMKLLRQNKGRIPLSIVLFDPRNKCNVELSSKKFSVDPTQDFLAGIQRLGLEYSLQKA